MNDQDTTDLLWMETFDFLCDEEKAWLKERAERQKSLAEWKKELGDFPAKARARYLRQEISRLSEELNRRADEYRAVLESPEHHWLLPLLEKKAEGLANMIRRYRKEMAVLKGTKGSDITDEMIERARNYPIEEIVEVRRGRARCVFHNGEHFNMDVRKNFAHCYVCGETGDAIAVYMAVNGVGFVQAVKALV